MPTSSGTRPRARLISIAALAAGALACAGAGPGGSDGGSDGGKRWEMSVGPFQVDARGELFRCNYARTPGEIAGRRFFFHATKYTHHVGVYVALGDVSQMHPGTRDCFGDLAQVTGSQYAGDFDFSFPPGVALELPANSWLAMEQHVINTGGEPVTSSAQMTVDEVDPSTVKTWAGMYLAGASFDTIRLPPHQRTTVTAHCPAYAGTKVALFASHAHELAKNVTIALRDQNGHETPMYDSAVANPRVVSDAPVTVGPGEEWVLRCNYDNEGPTTVVGGISGVQNEMCVMALSYWPKSDERMPVSCPAESAPTPE